MALLYAGEAEKPKLLFFNQEAELYSRTSGAAGSRSFSKVAQRLFLSKQCCYFELWLNFRSYPPPIIATIIIIITGLQWRWSVSGYFCLSTSWSVISTPTTL